MGKQVSPRPSNRSSAYSSPKDPRKMEPLSAVSGIDLALSRSVRAATRQCLRPGSSAWRQSATARPARPQQRLGEASGWAKVNLALAVSRPSNCRVRSTRAAVFHKIRNPAVPLHHPGAKSAHRTSSSDTFRLPGQADAAPNGCASSARRARHFSTECSGGRPRLSAARSAA